MHNTSTVRDSYIVAKNYTERIAILLHRLHPADKLLITNTLKLSTLIVLVSDCILALHLLTKEGWNKV